jgi:hypothetical protein
MRSDSHVRRAEAPRGLARLAAGALAMLLVPGCVFGPGHLQRGHLAYNEAVKSAADHELLLNLVRIRYVDTLDFMATTSVASQLELTVTSGARGGSDTLFGQLGALGYANLGYSTRPTFTFTPQRGEAFAKQLTEPVPVTLLAYLVASDWDVKMVLRLLVRRVNGVDNELGLPSPEFREITDALEALQIRNQLFVGFVSEVERVSSPIDASRVSGTDIVEAARAGYRFQQESRGGPFVLTSERPLPVVAFEPGIQDTESIVRLLRLRPGQPYYRMRPGVGVGVGDPERDTISIRTGSLLRALIYLSQGVDAPEEHVQQGLTTREWPPSSPGTAIDDIFNVRASKKKPDARLAVRHRGYWFYIPEQDLESRYTFYHIAELFRLGLAPGRAQEAPVLTLPVGGR